MHGKSTPVPVQTPPARKAWVAPRVEMLPRLTSLTLASGPEVKGEADVADPGGSVFS